MNLEKNTASLRNILWYLIQIWNCVFLHQLKRSFSVFVFIMLLSPHFLVDFHLLVQLWTKILNCSSQLYNIFLLVLQHLQNQTGWLCTLRKQNLNNQQLPSKIANAVKLSVTDWRNGPLAAEDIAGKRKNAAKRQQKVFDYLFPNN